MKIINKAKKARKFYDYLVKNWKAKKLSVYFSKASGSYKVYLSKDNFFGLESESIGEAEISSDNQIKIILNEVGITKKSYDFNKLRNLLKDYEKQEKVKILIEIA